MTTDSSMSASENGHTPGPWGVFSHNRTICIDNRGGDGRRPCVIDWPGFDGNDLPHSENMANARLIAAAPEMLDALKQALLHIERDEVAHGRPFAAGNVVRAAISKAEGGAA